MWLGWPADRPYGFFLACVYVCLCVAIRFHYSEQRVANLFSTCTVHERYSPDVELVAYIWAYDIMETAILNSAQREVACINAQDETVDSCYYELFQIIFVPL